MRLEVSKPDTKRKHHMPTPTELKPIEAKYESCEVVDPKEIDPKDIELLLDAYAKRPDVDLYTIAETLHISQYQLTKLLKDEKFAELHENAKIRRYERLMVEGYKLVNMPVEKFLKGEELSKEFVAACRNAANYSLHMSQTFSPEVSSKRNNEKGNVNIQINIPQLHHLKVSE